MKISPYIYAGMKTSYHSQNRKTLDEIFKSVEEVTGYTHKEIQGKSRVRPLADVRKMIAHYCVNVLNLTTTKTGSVLNKDHTTAIYSHRAAADLLKSDIEFSMTYNKIINKIKNRDYNVENFITIKEYNELKRVQKVDVEIQ